MKEYVQPTFNICVKSWIKSDMGGSQGRTGGTQGQATRHTGPEKRGTQGQTWWQMCLPSWTVARSGAALVRPGGGTYTRLTIAMRRFHVLVI